MSNTKFIIIYDTYCGWCYGSAPLFDAMITSGVEVDVLHKNLFRNEFAYRMKEGKGDLVMEADAKIASLSGQSFSQEYVDNIVLSETEVLDSTLTAQAAALLHDQGARKEFSLRARLEKNRYLHGISAQNRESVVDALIAEGISRDEANLLGTPALAKRSDAIAEKANDLMHSAGTRGVPTVLKMSDDTIEVIDHSAYYGNPEGFQDLVRDSIRRAS